MPRFLANINLSQNELQNAVIQLLDTDPVSPAPVEGQIYYNTTDQKVRVYSTSGWVEASVVDATDTQKGIIKLAGDLAGTADSPSIAAGAVTFDKIAENTIVDSNISPTANIDPTKIDGTAVIDNDIRLSDSRTPTGSAGGDLSGTYPNPTLASTGTAGTYTKVTTDSKGRVTSGTTLSSGDLPSHTHTLSNITDAGTAAGKNIPVSGNASATEVVYGTDTRLTNARTPSGSAGGDLAGTYPNPTVASGAIDSAKLRSTAGSEAVATSNIRSGAVTNTKLANSSMSINGVSISLGGSGTITAVPNDNSVSTGKIVNAAVTNAKLANSSITINGSAVSLGGSITVSGTPSGNAGGDLAGTYPNPSLKATGTAGTYTKVTTDSKGRVTSGTTLSSTDIPTNTPISGDVGGTLGASTISGLSKTKISGTAVTQADTGTVTNTMLAGSIADTKLSTISTSGKVANSATTATSANTASTIVARDASGNITVNKVTIEGTPTDAADAVPKSYADSISAGMNWHEAVSNATADVLPNSPTYTAGSADASNGYGIGAYLESATNARLVVDGADALNNERILVKDQADAKQNGIYVVTNQGAADPSGSKWKLTRASDNNNSVAGQVKAGDSVFSIDGNTNVNQGFIQTSVGSNPDKSTRIGTDNIVYTQFTGTSTLVAGTGLTKSGNVINANSANTGRIVVNADNIDLATVSQSNSSGTAGTSFIQSANVDSYGRVTGVVTASVSDATTLAKGIASFAAGDFNVTSGEVTIKSGGVDNSQLANSSITINSYSTSLGGSVSLTASDVSALASTSSLASIASANASGSAITASSQNITNVADPRAGATGLQDAATKNYVDTGLSSKQDASSALTTSTSFAGDVSGTYGSLAIGTGKVTSTNILDGTIVDGDISASAGISDTKLGTISTANKVSNSATTATNSNTPSTIVARDTSGNFSAGTITANLTGNVTGNVSGNAGTVTNGFYTTSSFYLGTTSIAVNRSSASQTLNGISIDGNAGTVTNGVYTTDSGTVTSTMIANDTIVNADINSAAGIVDTKLATISTAGKVSNSATTATDANTNSAIVARDGSGNFSAGTITATLTGTATGIASGSTQSGTAAGSTNKVVDIYSNPATSQNTATATALNLVVRGETMPRLTAQSNVALSTGAGYAMRILCTSTSNNINYISAACQAAGTVSACFFGLFNDSSGAIGSNIANTGSVSVTTGIITGQFGSAQSLTAGTYYWLAIGTTNTGNPNLKGASLVTGMAYGSNIKPYIAQAGTGWSSSGSTVTWPSSWTSTTFTSLPWMIIY